VLDRPAVLIGLLQDRGVVAGREERDDVDRTARLPVPPAPTRAADAERDPTAGGESEREPNAAAL
jgi:hypothetical protein